MSVYNISGTKIDIIPLAYPLSNIVPNHLIAHKGGSYNLEQPTIAICESTIADGFRMLEVDVVFTSDNIPVLSHSLSISVSGSSYSITNNTYQDLIAIKPDLATLKEFILTCKNSNAIVEIDFTKQNYTDAQCQILIDMIKQLGVKNRALITCTQTYARKLLNIEGDLSICVSMITTTALVDQIADIVAATSVCYGSLDNDQGITESQIAYMHEHGVYAKAFTVNSVNTVKTLYDIGIDLVIVENIVPTVQNGLY